MRLTITVVTNDEKSRDLTIDTSHLDVDSLLVALSLAPEVKEVVVRPATKH